ncbi:hypothetical protein, partial [Acidiphilium multivorum]
SAETAISAWQKSSQWLCLGKQTVPDGLATTARHEFMQSPPGKAGFRISSGLLSRFSPALDQLQQRLAAAPQTLAFLDLVDEGDSLVGELEQHLLRAGVPKALAVADVPPNIGSGGFWHRRISNQFPRELTVGASFGIVYHFFAAIRA